jgi:ATP phosphoribosyltransferase
MKEELTYLFLPKGEWLESLLVAFQLANLSLLAPKRGYEYTIASQALPIIFEACRSKEVWNYIQDPDVKAKGGFVGTDVAAEQSIMGYDQKLSAELLIRQGQIDRDEDPSQLEAVQWRSWRVPFQDRKVNPAAVNPKLYVGSTPWLQEWCADGPESRDPDIRDLRNTTIYTEYPNVTKQYLTRRGINAYPANVKAVQGGSEGLWRTNPKNGAVVTIRSSGDTMAANGIKVMEDIMSPELVYVEGEMSQQDKLRVDDLRETFFKALRSVMKGKKYE